MGLLYVLSSHDLKRGRHPKKGAGSNLGAAMRQDVRRTQPSPVYHVSSPGPVTISPRPEMYSSVPVESSVCRRNIEHRLREQYGMA